MNHSPQPPAPPAAPRRARWLLAAAAVAVAGAVIAGAVLLGGDDPDGTVGADPSTFDDGPAADAGATEATGEGEPLTAAPATEWVSESGVFVPVSADGHGPAAVDAAGVPSGFAHTPEGALIAAAQILIRTGAAFDPAARAAVVEACVTGEAAEVEAFAAATADLAPISAAQASVPAAFDYLAYAPETATVELVMDSGVEGVYGAVTATVTWTGQDWALEAPRGGDLNNAVQSVSDLDGLIPWGPGISE